MRLGTLQAALNPKPRGDIGHGKAIMGVVLGFQIGIFVEKLPRGLDFSAWPETPKSLDPKL